MVVEGEGEGVVGRFDVVGRLGLEIEGVQEWSWGRELG